jgi:hypothetical protein
MLGRRRGAYIPIRPDLAWDCGGKTNPAEGDMASDGRVSYCVYSGRRTVSVRKAWSGAEAVIEYLTTLGCKSSELSTVGPNAVMWRGATFKAEPATVEPTS